MREVPGAGYPGGVNPRSLGPLTLLALGINGIVGVGIFVSPPIVAAAVPGERGAVLYVLIALGCLPIALAYARLARAMPRDGGPYLYAEHAFGRRVALSIGALVWVSSVFSTAAVTRALSDLCASALHHPGWSPAIAVSLVVALAAVNARGLRLSALAWTVLTALKLAPLITIAVLGLTSKSSSTGAVSAAAVASTVATAPSPIGPALLAILFALQGFEIVPLPAGQARDAERTVPRATVASLLAAAVLYAFVHLACVRTLPSLATIDAPITAAARALGGTTLARAVGFGVVASIAGIVVGMHAMTPRYLAALFDRSARPFATETFRHEASDRDEQPPTRASTTGILRSIVISAVLIAPLVAFGSLQRLVSLSSVAVLAQYGVTASALFQLSRLRRHGLVPRDAWPVPLMLVVVVVLLLQARPLEVAFAAGVAALGAAFTLRARPA